MFVFLVVRPTPSSAPSRGGAKVIWLLTQWHRTACFVFFSFRFTLFCFLSAMRFRLGAPPPSRDCGLRHLSISCWFSPFVSPPRHDCSLREGFDFGFPCLRACVLLQLAFLRLAPPRHADGTREGLTVVCLAIAPFSSRPPRHTGGTRQVLTGGSPY